MLTVTPELGYRHRRDDPAEHAAAPPPVRLRRLAAQRDAAGVCDHSSGTTATRAPPDGGADGVREEHRDDMACHDRGVRSGPVDVSSDGRGTDADGDGREVGIGGG